MATLTWLHLSDWHQRGEDFNRDVVRDRLIDDIRQRAERIDPRVADLDLIVFSGDAAQGGRKAEYEAAQRHLFDPVLDAAGLEPESLFLVPGNHDLDREAFELLPAALQAPLDSEEEVQRWLTDDRRRERLLEPFEAYAEFVTAYSGQPQPAYASLRRLETGGKQIALLGLNSAWMCGRPDDAGRIDDRNRVLVGEPQVHRPLDEIADADLRIAVLHHPLDWLAELDRERIEDRLVRACHFVLHGHQHRPRVLSLRGTSGECVVIPAGACYNRRVAEHPRYNNAYNLVHLDLDSGRGIVFLRRWNDTRNVWVQDTETHSTGVFEFRLFAEAEPESSEAEVIPTPEVVITPAQVLPEDLPHPLAVGSAGYNRAASEVERFEALDRLVYNLVKYLTAVALSQYWQDNPDRERLWIWLGRLSEARLRPSLQILDEIAGHYAAAAEKPDLYPLLFEPYVAPVEADSPLVVAYGLLRRPGRRQRTGAGEVTPQAFLSRLLELRETEWERAPGAVNAELCARLCGPLREALARLLEIFRPLLDHPLHFVERVDRDGEDWVYSLTAFAGAGGEACRAEPYREPGVERASHKALRLYLCAPEGRPLLNLHPFLIAQRNKLFFLEYAPDSEEPWYGHCASPERFPAPRYHNVFASLMKGSKEAAGAEDPVAHLELANTMLQREEVARRVEDMSLHMLLEQLSSEGREALEIALGEALRIGRFWLGVEFLLMGLTKQEGRPLGGLLHRLWESRTHFRGKLRGMAGVVAGEEWRDEDVWALGREAFGRLEAADPEALARCFAAGEEPGPVVTPRMVEVLREAVRLAGAEPVGHRHLLQAVLQQPTSLAVNWLYTLAMEAGWQPKDVQDWAAQAMGPGMMPAMMPALRPGLGVSPRRRRAPRPEEPDERERQTARNEAAFPGAFAALQERLAEHEIEVEVDEGARRFLCDPFYHELPLEEALVQLVELPLRARLEAGEFKAGDRLCVERYANELEFKKVEGGES